MPAPTYQQCQTEVAAKRVTCRRSNDGRYEVFNYAETVEFNDEWNDVNVWCRGLVFDVGVTPPIYVAVPFKKFWNVGQRPETRAEALALLGDPVDIREKLDGSLGVGFIDNNGKLRVSTRGSLESEQAHWATEWINDPANHHDGSYDALRFVVEEMGLTPLFEIIYNENRIVVSYAFEGLVCLNMVDRSTGHVLGLDECGNLFPPKWRQASDDYVGLGINKLLEAAKGLQWDHEGWVVRWSNGMMAKIKGDEYLRIHRIRFGMSPKRIHEALIEGTDPGQIEGYPDEFMQELRTTRDTIVNEHEQRMNAVLLVLERALAYVTRKEQALFAKERLPVQLLSTFFAFLDGDKERARRLCMSSINPDEVCHAAQITF